METDRCRFAEHLFNRTKIKNMKILLTSICLTLATAGFAQTAEADYKRISALTKSAFSVAERQYTYKIETKYVDNPRSTSSSSTSSTKSYISGDYSSYPAINVGKRRLQQQAEAGARQEAGIATFEAKMKRVEDLIKSRNLSRSPENHAALVQAAMDGGLNAYEASRFFGNTPEEYRNMLLSKNAADYKWSGGIKGDCQGDCVENLTSPYGFTYKGNAKYGQPHGKGVMVGEKATYTGDFVAGEPNGQVEIRWNKGPVFTGTSYNGELIKGNYKAGGTDFQGTFLNHSYYRGLMKADGVEIVGEFNATPSTVYGMRRYPEKNTYHGFYTGKEEKATYYLLTEFKNGLKKEEIFDNNNKMFGYVIYYASGVVVFSVPHDDSLRLGWRINPDGNAYYVLHNKDNTSEMTRLIIKPEDLPALKSRMETFMNELQRRRQEYQQKMEAVFEAIATTADNGSQTATNAKNTETVAASNAESTIAFNGGLFTGELNGAKQPHGHGTYKSADGSYSYEGNYVNGKPMGKGKSTWKNGEIYEGDFVNGRRQGTGKYTRANGDVYEGEHFDGMWHGKGRVTYTNGKVEEGIWFYGEMDPKPIITGPGKAKFEWKDKTYIGAYVNGKRTGKGKLTGLDGTVYEGDFVDGLRHGKGKFTWESAGGGAYEGEFLNNRFSGKGKETDSNGNIYVGEFKEGMKHGKGKMTHSDGKVEEGNWERGTFKGNN
jgi:hypothetical protein